MSIPLLEIISYGNHCFFFHHVSLPQGKHWKITDNLLVGLAKLPESLRQQLCRALLEKYDLASLR